FPLLDLALILMSHCYSSCHLQQNRRKKVFQSRDLKQPVVQSPERLHQLQHLSTCPEVSEFEQLLQLVNHSGWYLYPIRQFAVEERLLVKVMISHNDRYKLTA